MIRVLVVDDIIDTRENLKKLLLFEDDIEVVGAASTGEQGIELARQLQPDVVIMDINMPGIDGITAASILTRELPGIQIIMMSVQGEADYLRRSMLAGAREFLVKPPSADEIINSIRRVAALGTAQRAQMAALTPMPAPVAPPAGSVEGTPAAQQRQPAARATGGRMIAVFGTKGGAGASSVAINFAVMLQTLLPEARVGVVDSNPEFGDLNVLLNLKSERSIIDLIAGDELDAQYISEIFVAHPSGLKVLPGAQPAEAELVTGEQVKRLIEPLRAYFDYIIFDTRCSFGEPTLTVLDHADTVLVVSTAEIPSIRNTRLFFEVTEQLDYPAQKIKLVLNKCDAQSEISVQAIESSIRHPVTVQVPRDDRAAGVAIQQGLPYVMNNPRSPLAQAMEQLVQETCGLDVKQLKQAKQAEQSGKTNQTDVSITKKRLPFQWLMRQ
jgi:pilus assembly protein CpaE